MKKINIEWYIIVFGLLILLPFLALCFYNHPATDDYSCANDITQLGFWNTQISYYNNWKCAVVSVMIVSVSPLLINWFWGYKIIPFILLLTYIFLLHTLIKTLAGYSLKTYQKWAIVFSFLISYFYYVPNVAHAFYWSSSILTYQIFTMLVIIFMILLVKLKYKKEHKNKLTFFLALLVILIMQGSETYMVFMFVLISTLLFLSTILQKRFNRIYVVLFFVSVAVILFVLTSPGIYKRAMIEHTTAPSRQISTALKFTFLDILEFVYSKTAFLIFLFAMLLPAFDTFFSRLRERVLGIPSLLVNPFIAFFITIFFSSVFLFPVCYIRQYYSVGRVSNIAYFYFLMGAFYTLFCLWQYFKQKYSISLNGKTYKRIQWTLLCVSVTMISLPNNVRAAYADIILGRASDYDAQLNKRYEIIASCKSDTCVVPPLRHATSLGSMDITTNTAAWENQAYSIFFGKKAIRLSEDYNYQKLTSKTQNN